MSNESKALELATELDEAAANHLVNVTMIPASLARDASAELRRQHAEIESLRSQLAEAATEIRAEQERRRAEIRAQLARELEAVRKDAERYRWLREYYSPEVQGRYMTDVDRGFYSDGDELDSAIDAAMKD
jgi:hypothetical protein